MVTHEVFASTLYLDGDRITANLNPAGMWFVSCKMIFRADTGDEVYAAAENPETQSVAGNVYRYKDISIEWPDYDALADMSEALKEMEASIMEMTIGESGAFDEENLAIAFTDELQFSVYGYRDESEPNSGTYYQDNSPIYILYYGQSDGTFVSIGQISGNELTLNLSMRTGMSITPASITLTFELSTN